MKFPVWIKKTQEENIQQFWIEMSASVFSRTVFLTSWFMLHEFCKREASESSLICRTKHFFSAEIWVTYGRPVANDSNVSRPEVCGKGPDSCEIYIFFLNSTQPYCNFWPNWCYRKILWDKTRDFQNFWKLKKGQDKWSDFINSLVE